MTKKILTLTFIVGLFGISNAQNIELTLKGDSTTLVNETMITFVDTVGIDSNQKVTVYVDVKSKYSTNKYIKVKKIEKTSSNPSGAKNAVCWGVCTLEVPWGSEPVVISDPLEMKPNQKIAYTAYIYPKLQGGSSVIRYVWFDENNTNDSTWVDVKIEVVGYTGLSELKKSTKLNIYPNPVRNNLTITLNSKAVNKTIAITDMLGKIVYTNTVVNNDQKINVNTSSFKLGVYFVSVLTDNQILKTEKLIVTN